MVHSENENSASLLIRQNEALVLEGLKTAGRIVREFLESAPIEVRSELELALMPVVATRVLQSHFEIIQLVDGSSPSQIDRIRTAVGEVIDALKSRGRVS